MMSMCSGEPETMRLLDWLSAMSRVRPTMRDCGAACWAGSSSRLRFELLPKPVPPPRPPPKPPPAKPALLLSPPRLALVDGVLELRGEADPVPRPPPLPPLPPLMASPPPSL